MLKLASTWDGGRTAVSNEALHMNRSRSVLSPRGRRSAPPRRQLVWIGSSYARRLRIESLEDRRLLAGVTVPNNLDHVDGSVQSIDALIALPGPDGISLREAIEAANATAGADEIFFDGSLSGQTILLTGGPLTIDESLTIDAGSLGANVTIDAQQASRLIHYTGLFGDLTLVDLTLRNGKTTANIGMGGGILFGSNGTLTLNRCSLTGNSTTGDTAGGGAIATENGAITLIQSTVTGNSTTGTDGDGGAIYSFSGAVVLKRSRVSENHTTGPSSDGGGIFVSSGPLTLSQSTVSGNHTGGNAARGGGIFSESGPVRINQSTVSGNFTLGANAHGGGISTNGATVTLYGSTLSGNRTEGTNADGGGLYKRSGIANLFWSTITNNRTTNSGSDGGGIYVSDSVSISQVLGGSMILAGNTAGTGNIVSDLVANPDAAVFILSSVIGTQVPNNPDDENIVTNNPQLGPLADNGGRTQTHALLPGSPAIDAGSLIGLNDFLIHVYELNGSLADALGGPALVSGGGTLSATGTTSTPTRDLVCPTPFWRTSTRSNWSSRSTCWAGTRRSSTSTIWATKGAFTPRETTSISSIRNLPQACCLPRARRRNSW
jgi:hypothetical protein